MFGKKKTTQTGNTGGGPTADGAFGHSGSVSGGNTAGNSQGYAGKRGMPAGSPVLDYAQREKAERKRRAAKRHIVFFTLLFVALFVYMAYYFVSYAVENRVELFNNDYNKRDELLESRNKRGNIYASDAQTLLATTQTSTDSDGEVTQTRVYPFGRVYAHVVGYADMGGSGLEEYAKYDLLHSDLPLSDKVTYDAADTADGRLYPGNNVITTLDSELQQAAYEAMGNYDGAVIVTEPSTGRILAMVSKPDYDPNDIVRNWNSLVSDTTTGTLLNRATQGLYPPGSTFKIVDCIDLLSEDPDAAETYSFNCTGTFEQDGETIHCYNYEVHGLVDLRESFAQSCNSSFANIGVNVITTDSMSETLRTLLFNQKLPYDLPSVRSSVSDPGTLSTEGLMQMSIGQGTTAMSPLHLNMITAAVANGGELMKPHLIDALHDARGRTLRTYDAASCGQLMSEEVSEEVTDLMRAVVTEGTASSLSGRSYEAAGKTGSAEFDNSKNSHAWFTGFAPASDPQICVTVLIEGEGMGSSYAVPVAAQIFDAYFND